MIVVLAFALATLPPSVYPWPIGAGPRYHPSAAPTTIRAARPVASYRCGPDATRFRVHLELFANRRAVVVPAGIGVAAPYVQEGGDVHPGGCVYALHTMAPTGVVEVGVRGATVGDLFRVWGRRLGAHRLLSFASQTRVRVFVGGSEQSGDPRLIRLTSHAQIVLEIGGYVAPHPSYLFPKGAP